jgi:hypothetical protein
MKRQGSRSETFIAENFGGERFESCAFLPGVGGKVSFATSLLKEGGAVPIVVGGDLGQ